MGQKKADAAKSTDTFLPKPAVSSAGFIVLLLVFLSGDERSGALHGHESRTACRRQLSGLLHGLCSALGGFRFPFAAVCTWNCSWPQRQQEKPHVWFDLEVCDVADVVVAVVGGGGVDGYDGEDDDDGDDDDDDDDDGGDDY